MWINFAYYAEPSSAMNLFKPGKESHEKHLRYVLRTSMITTMVGTALALAVVWEGGSWVYGQLTAVDPAKDYATGLEHAGQAASETK